MLTQQTFQPHIQQNPGILGPLVQGASSLGAGYFASSKKVKENIRDYKKSIDVLKDLTVKQYDYTEEVGGKKNRVGIIAETLPNELTDYINGILHVDIYGLVGLMINTIKDLNDKVLQLEAK